MPDLRSTKQSALVESRILDVVAERLALTPKDLLAISRKLKVSPGSPARRLMTRRTQSAGPDAFSADVALEKIVRHVERANQPVAKDDPAVLYKSRGDRLWARLNGGGAELAACGVAVSGVEFLTRLEEILERAEHDIMIYASSMKMSKSRRTRLVLGSLIKARKRKVQVRVMYEPDDDQSLWSHDIATLRLAGIAVAPWPFRTALHSRLVVADDRVLVGSHGLSQSSLFRTQEFSIECASGALAARVRQRFDLNWAVAHGSFPLELCASRAQIETLRTQGVKDLRDLLKVGPVDGITRSALERLRRTAKWIVEEKVPPVPAQTLANLRRRAGYAERIALPGADDLRQPIATEHVLHLLPALVKRLAGKDA